MDGTIEELDQSQLVQLVRELQAEVARLRDENQQLKDRIKQLEGKKPTPRVDEPYSVDAEEKRRQKKYRQKKRKQQSKRRGRRPTEEKAEQAELLEIIYP